MAADVVARDFVTSYAEVFGLTHPAMNVSHVKTRAYRERKYVRLQQTMAELPVFAAQMTVQVDSDGGVEAVVSDIARDVALTDDDLQSTAGQITEAEAIARAIEGRAQAIELRTSEPRLMVFVPAVLEEPGEPRLVWAIEVTSADVIDDAQVLIDAKTGDVVRRYPLSHHARDREIYDANGANNDPGSLVRVEGGLPTNIADVDDAYRFYGDTYAFYSIQHGRDSIDDGGMTMSATVRYCGPPDNPGDPPRCPPKGLAFWSNGQRRMYFGTGYASEDVTGHELTHGVTYFTSQLVYSGISGAINESFSDIWGEFIDLTYGPDRNNPAVRWLIGQNIPSGILRSMQDPPTYGDPDRLGSSKYSPTGGVHTNSGIANKLAYLLTDGDTFNGQDVSGLGIPRVADLFYEVNANLLTSGADWTELYDALRQAAVNLSWSDQDRNNLYRACLAVEIASSGRAIYVDNTASCVFADGTPTCSGFDFGGPFVTVVAGAANADPGDVLHVHAGTYGNGGLAITKILTVTANGGNVVMR